MQQSRTVIHNHLVYLHRIAVYPIPYICHYHYTYYTHVLPSLRSGSLSPVMHPTLSFVPLTYLWYLCVRVLQAMMYVHDSSCITYHTTTSPCRYRRNYSIYARYVKHMCFRDHAKNSFTRIFLCTVGAVCTTLYSRTYVPY